MEDLPIPWDASDLSFFTLPSEQALFSVGDSHYQAAIENTDITQLYGDNPVVSDLVLDPQPDVDWQALLGTSARQDGFDFDLDNVREPDDGGLNALLTSTNSTDPFFDYDLGASKMANSDISPDIYTMLPRMDSAQSLMPNFSEAFKARADARGQGLDTLFQQVREQKETIQALQLENAQHKNRKANLFDSNNDVFPKRFYCTDFPPCNRSFYLDAVFKSHVRSHNLMTRYQCRCGVNMTDFELWRHRQTCSENIPAGSFAPTSPRNLKPVRIDRVRQHQDRARPATLGRGGPMHDRGNSKNPSSSSTSRSGKGLRRVRLPPKAVSILEDWFVAHNDYPYPTFEEKHRLCADTSLVPKNVDTWLSNARRRRYNTATTTPDLDPFQLWLSGSSEDEAANMEDIRAAAMTTQLRASSSMSSFPNKREFDNMSSANSLSSCGSAFDSCQEARIQGPPKRGRRKYSYQGHHTVPIAAEHADRFARRPSREDQASCERDPFQLWKISDDNLETSQVSNSMSTQATSWLPSNSLSMKGNPLQADTGQARQPATFTPLHTYDLSFECTFCFKKLSAKSWKRHEESQHVPQGMWMCMARDATQECIFCTDPASSQEETQLCKHRSDECADRHVTDRMFDRRDKLVQHIKTYHGCAVSPSLIDMSWSPKGSQQSNWDCGFCDTTAMDWDTRAKHISKHFRDGKTMSMWRTATGTSS